MTEKTVVHVGFVNFFAEMPCKKTLRLKNSHNIGLAKYYLNLLQIYTEITDEKIKRK